MHYTLPSLSPRMPKSLNSATEAHVSLVRQMQCTCNGHGQHRSNTAWLYSCFQLTCFLLLWHHQRYACTNWSLGCVRAKMEADKEKQSILELRHLTPKVDCHPWTISGPLVISNPARVSSMFENSPREKNFKRYHQVTGLSLVFECMKIQLNSRSCMAVFSPLRTTCDRK